MAKLKFSTAKVLLSFISCGGDLDKEEVRDTFSCKEYIRRLKMDLKDALDLYDDELTQTELSQYEEIIHFLNWLLRESNIQEYPTI